MRQNPTAIFIIDLHRDAAAYMGNVGRTVLVNGETTATYSLVIGQGNVNADALRAYANRIHAKAEEMFPGFGGRNIEKPHRFNQYISDYHILLEVGNNENNIKEARNTAKYLAQVLAEVIKDIKQLE
jgi:stage II sporulation protein P